MRARSGTVFAALVVAVVMLVSALAVVAAQDFFEGRNPDEFPQPTITFDESAMRSVPVLTDELRQQSIDAALNDPRVQAIIDEHSYQIADVVIWTGAEDRLMGVVVTLAFDKPATVAGQWVALSWDCNVDPVPPPFKVPYTATYADVTQIDVLANADTKAVDFILPRSSVGPITLVGEQTFTSDVTTLTDCSRD